MFEIPDNYSTKNVSSFVIPYLNIYGPWLSSYEQTGEKSRCFYPARYTVDEIVARQEKIYDKIKISFDIHPTFYTREVKTFGNIIPDHLPGLLHLLEKC